MKFQSKIENILKEIWKDPIKKKNENKKKWYKVRKYLLQGNKLTIHNKSKVAARRIYQFYSKFKGDWKGPTSWKFSKMKKEKFSELLKKWEELEREILLAFSELSAGHMTEDHVIEQYMIDHIIKDYEQ